jgi:hypothetical protein
VSLPVADKPMEVIDDVLDQRPATKLFTAEVVLSSLTPSRLKVLLLDPE